MANDHKRLIEESDMIQVLDYMGYKTVQKGVFTFLYCPVHERDLEGTNHPLNNCFTKNGDNYCYCKRCAKGFNTKDYLIEKEQIDFGKAYDLLYTIMGEPSYYKTRGNKKTKKEKEVEEKESKLFNILGLRSNNMSKYLFPKEKEILISIKKQKLEVRMSQLNELFGRELFESEKNI